MNVIVAVNADWGIGYNGTQTIVIPEDRRYFKKLTEGGVVIAGRKTYEDFRRPLPNRKNIILTRDKAFKADGAVVLHTVDEVLAEISGHDTEKVFVIGGGDIYRLLLPLCSRAYVTKIEAAPPSDTFFPSLDDLPGWTLENSEFGMRNSELSVDYSFNLYTNNTPGLQPLATGN